MKIIFADQEFILDASGALYWPEKSILIVADAHLEKGSFFARWGFHLPPYDSQMTLERLADAQARYAPKQILILGDFFHDAKAHDRLSADSRKLFDAVKRSDILWVKGNHDVALKPDGVDMMDEYEHTGIMFRHEALDDSHPEISGHFHPKSRFVHKGTSLAGRCFIEDGKKFILPAFGAYTGGLFTDHQSISRHFSDNPRRYLIINERIVAISD